MYLFTYNGNKHFERTHDLEAPVLSIYQPFVFSGEDSYLYIVNEDEQYEDPLVVKYEISGGLKLI